RPPLRVDVVEGDVALAFEPVTELRIGHRDVALAVRRRHAQAEPLLDEHAAVLGAREGHPAARVVVAQVRRQRHLLKELPSLRPRQEPEPGEHLEAVADPEHEPAAVDEPEQRITEALAELVREHASGGDVVAVGEAARHDEDREPVEPCRRRTQRLDVHELRIGARRLEGVRRLTLAVDARGPQDQCAGSRHTDSSTSVPSRSSGALNARSAAAIGTRASSAPRLTITRSVESRVKPPMHANGRSCRFASTSASRPRGTSSRKRLADSLNRISSGRSTPSTGTASRSSVTPSRPANAISAAATPSPPSLRS